MLPLHATAPVHSGDITFVRLTMANLPVGSQLMWVHLFMVLLCLAWIFLLLEWHTRQYCSLRQQYIRGMDAPNTWRGEGAGGLVGRRRREQGEQRGHRAVGNDGGANERSGVATAG